MQATSDTMKKVQVLNEQIVQYVFSDEYVPQFTFGYFLKEYIKILSKKRKDFASDIGIDAAMLSNYINHHRIPPDYICIRLEIHSGRVIGAENWYKLLEKAREHFIKTDKKMRQTQERYVRSEMALLRS